MIAHREAEQHLRDVPTLLQHAVDEAVRLLRADGAFIDLCDPETGRIRWAYDAGIAAGPVRDMLRSVELDPGEGIFGRAVSERRVLVTRDYLTDDGFTHAPGPDEFARRIGLRSVVVAPLLGESGAIGALGAIADRVGAFDDEQSVALVRALADHAAAVISNTQLIERLAGSQVKLGHLLEAQHTLGRIAAEISALHDPGEVVQRVTDEATRLLRADGAMVYLLDRETGKLRFAYDAGLAGETRALMRSLTLPMGGGLIGTAVERRRVVVTPDYIEDHSFRHEPEPDRIVRVAGIRSMAAAPLIAEDVALGGLGVFSAVADAFDDDATSLLQALADHAAAALANARLIDELARSRSAAARSADAERALRDIAARITVLHRPDEVLQLVVDESKRLLGSDGAHLTQTVDGRDFLVPVVIAEETDPGVIEWLRTLEFPIGGGMNGLAAVHGECVRTDDYLVDPRIPHEPDDDLIARRLRLRAMGVAPLRAPGGTIIGTLAISYEEPRHITDAEMDLLQGLADHAAIALTNARLYDDLKGSEARYRLLVEQSPDLIFSLDAEGRFTFLSETCEARTGYRPQELLGKHFSVLIDESALPEVARRWQEIVSDPSVEQQVRFQERRRDGTLNAVEVHAAAIVRDGVFSGIHGASRDVSRHERMERDLRAQAAQLAANEERAHLARELHDSVTQALFSMALTSRSVELLMDRDLTAARQRLAELSELQRDALAEMRSLIFELRPGSLERDGLVQALRTHATAIEGRTGLSILVEAGDVAGRLPLAIEDTLYRIAQEALHNVVKHAAAHNVALRLRDGSGVARLGIEDDGTGFDPALVPPGRLGLAGMRTRAERLGGSLEVSSRPGAGTRVEVALPLERPVA